MQHGGRRHTTTLKTPQVLKLKRHMMHAGGIYSTDTAAYQNLAHSDAINVEISRLWEDGNCSMNQKEKKGQRSQKYEHCHPVN